MFSNFNTEKVFLIKVSTYFVCFFAMLLAFSSLTSSVVHALELEPKKSTKSVSAAVEQILAAGSGTGDLTNYNAYIGTGTISGLSLVKVLLEVLGTNFIYVTQYGQPLKSNRTCVFGFG